MTYFIRIVLLLFVISSVGFIDDLRADTADTVKRNSKKAVSDIKQGATETGKAAVKMSREIKEKSQKTWVDVKKSASETGKTVKEGAVEVAHEIKKAFRETKDAIQKEVNSGGDSDR